MESVAVMAHILGRQYPLRVPPEDEVAVRETADIIDKLARRYASEYHYNDHQDLLAMVSLYQVSRLVKLQKQNQFKDTDLAQKLLSIDSLLEDILHPDQHSL